MRVTGHKKLMRQFRDLPQETREALEKSVGRTAKFGERKARAIVPVLEGDLKRGINSNVEATPDAILGFINFFDGSGEELAENGLAANAINYGWPKGQGRAGYDFRATVGILIGDRHKRTVTRLINKAIKEAFRG